MERDLPAAGRDGIEQLENGELIQAKKEFARLHVKAGMKNNGILKSEGKGERYWRQVEELAEEAVQVIHNSSEADEALNRLENVFDGWMLGSSGISYQAGVGEPEKNVSESDTDEVVQDRIDFLEEEIKRSQEDLLELKEELEELRGEEEE
jgi:hypothetical protein